MELVRTLWTAEGRISHHGKHYSFDDVRITPKPVQQRHENTTLGSNPCILVFHIADDSLTTIVHMDVLDADVLLAAVSQASKDLNLGCISFHQASRRRPERRNSLLGCEGNI